jgi:hypothetical protein
MGRDVEITLSPTPRAAMGRVHFRPPRIVVGLLDWRGG